MLRAVCEPPEEGAEADADPLKRDYSVDALVARLEAVIVREYEKGGTAASMKTAVDRAIDRLQAEADAGGVRARGAFAKAMERMQVRFGVTRLDEDGPAADSDPLREPGGRRI